MMKYISGAGMKKFGLDLENEQEVLISIADIMIEIYMAESALLRAEKNFKKGDENQEGQIAMSQLYLYEAVQLIEKRSKELIYSLAEKEEQKFLLMGLKRFFKIS